MGRDIGGHADGYAGGTVHEQVGKTRGQDLWLLTALVEVGVPVHGVLFNIAEHLVRDLGHSGLGVSVGCRGISVHRAEVAVALYERVAHGEVLREPDERVVDRLVAVRVVVTQHVADCGGAFFESLIRGKSALIHRVEYAPVHGLEPVPHVRQRPAHDDAHGIAHVALFHLANDLARDDLLTREHYILGFIILCHCVTTLGVDFKSLVDRLIRLIYPDLRHTVRSSRYIPFSARLFRP